MSEYDAAALFMVLFVPAAAALSWFISRGWRDLATAYRLNDQFSGERWFFRTGVIADTTYGCLLIVGGDLRGAYFSTCLPSAICPPLLIPWGDIQGVERKGLLVRFVELKFVKGPPDGQHEISGRVADRLESVSGGAWRYQRAKKTVIFGRD